MAFVQADRQLLVHEFRYRMNARDTGTLFMLDGPGYGRLISWESATTGLRTKWHGNWVRTTPAGFFLEFDFKGREHMADRKWAMVFTADAIEYVPNRTWYFGDDYEHRRILMVHKRTWSFDEHSSAYVSR